MSTLIVIRNRFASSLIMAVIYGFEPQPRDDPFVTSVQKILHIITLALAPERSAMLMFFPFRKCLFCRISLWK